MRKVQFSHIVSSDEMRRLNELQHQRFLREVDILENGPQEQRCSLKERNRAFRVRAFDPSA